MGSIDRKALARIAAECPGFQARATARALTRHYNASLRELHLTAEQFALLVGIGAQETPSIVELAASSGLDTTTLSRTVRILEERGLVQSEGGRGRMGKRLQLTPAGELIVADGVSIWRKTVADLTKRVGAARLRAAQLAMAELAEAVS